MIYSVRWSRRALDSLAEIWVDNPAQREGITRAAASIERLLRFNPDDQGESRDKNRRVLFVPPMVIFFRIDESHRLVRILNVRLLRRRRTD